MNTVGTYFLHYITLFQTYFTLASDDMSFNGTSMVKLNLLRDPISATREIIRFRFKTSVANGILLYSRGSQGDYIALQLRENRLLLNLDLGKFILRFIVCFLVALFTVCYVKLTKIVNYIKYRKKQEIIASLTYYFLLNWRGG